MEVVSSSSTGLVTQNCPLQSSKEEWCSISPYTFLTLEIYLRKIIFRNIYKYLAWRKKNMVLFIAVWMYIAHRFWIQFYSQDCCYENWIVCVIFFNWDQSKSTCSCQKSLHLSLINIDQIHFLVITVIIVDGLAGFLLGVITVTPLWSHYAQTSEMDCEFL